MKEFVLPLTKSSEASRVRLKSISVRELSEKCYMLVMQIGNGDTKKVKLVPKYVKDMLRRYQDVMSEDLPNELLPREKLMTKSR